MATYKTLILDEAEVQEVLAEWLGTTLFKTPVAVTAIKAPTAKSRDRVFELTLEVEPDAGGDSEPEAG